MKSDLEKTPEHRLDERLRMAVESYAKGDRGEKAGKVMLRLRQRARERRKI